MFETHAHITVVKFMMYFLCLFVSAVAIAQTMTDEQIVSFIRSESAAGKDEKTIGAELLAKGISMDRLLQLRQKYESLKSGEASFRQSEEIDRSRVDNGEQFESGPGNRQDSTAKSRIFGHDIFRSKNPSFAPNMNLATPVTYVLGPGDEVIMDIYGASQSSTKYKISPDGAITVTDIGPVSIAGMTVAEAQNKVREKVGGYYRDSNIKLTVGQTRTILVNIMGEVEKPGTYTLSAFATVFNALYLAGGVNELGTLRNIKLSRNGKVISAIDVYDFILNGNLTGDVMLQDNDVILVGAYENLVTVEGCVKRPMVYEMKDSESLYMLLRFAGGFTGDAYRDKLRVERLDGDGLTVHNVEKEDFHTFARLDGDIVVASPVIERYRNTVFIDGAVFRPGKYKLSREVNSVKALVEQAGGLVEQAFVTRAVILRMNPDRTLTSLTVNLDGILNGTADDIPLRNEDKLYISSLKELNDLQYLTISGEVMKPGEYRYARNTSIEDLIVMAGGLKESASLLNIEVARRIVSEDNVSGDKMAEVFSLSLNEGLSITDGAKFSLEPYDIVIIRKNPSYKEQETVSIRGEVFYGGDYVLRNKEERLSDIVTRAGGMTDKAAVANAQLVRKYSDIEIGQKKQMLEMAATRADSLSILSELKDSTYTVGIDLEEAMKNPGSMADVVMYPGDEIIVPILNNIVKISGEVLYPNNVSFSKGKNYKYYIKQAGGVKKTGQQSQAYIIYANGQVSPVRHGEITPGCEIVVPQKVKKDINPQTASIWLGSASVLASIAAVIATILR